MADARLLLYRLNAFGLLLLVGFVLLALARPQVSPLAIGPRDVEAFCARPDPMTFSMGFTRLPTVTALPDSARDGRGFHLPFAPPGVKIHTDVADPPIFAGPGRQMVGYRLSQAPEEPRAEFQWKFELRL